MGTEIWVAIIALVGTFFGVLANLVANIKNYKLTRLNLQMQNELKEREIKIKEKEFSVTGLKEQLKEINRKLIEFYEPVKKQLDTSYTFYKLFKEGFDEDFRALVYFLDKKNIDKLPKSKKILFQNVLKANDRIIELIDTKMGLIDDEFYSEYHPDPKVTDVELTHGENILQVLKGHYSMMNDVFEGQFSTEDMDTVKNYIYPREFNKMLDNRIASLNSEKTKLLWKIDNLSSI